MDTNLSQTLRQLKVLQLINQRQLISQRQLADHFQVHARTINRDLDTLMEVFPIISRWLNRQKHYTFMDGFQLPQFTFTLAESMALLLAKQLGQRLSGISYFSAAAKSVDQILALLPANYRRQLQQIQQVIAFKTDQSPVPPQQAHWAQIASQAALDRRCLQLVYLTTQTGQLNQRVVEPFFVNPELPGIRLVAFCQLRQANREFLFSRMKSLSLLDQFFEPQPFDIDLYLSGSRIKDQPLTAKLVVSPPLTRWLDQDPPAGLKQQTPLPADQLSLLVDTEGRKELLYWVLKYGCLVEVIEPQSLRAEVMDQLQSTLKKYQP